MYYERIFTILILYQIVMILSYIIGANLALKIISTDITHKQLTISILVATTIGVLFGLLQEALAKANIDPSLFGILINFAISFLTLRYVGQIKWKTAVKINLVTLPLAIVVMLIFMEVFLMPMIYAAMGV